MRSRSCAGLLVLLTSCSLAFDLDGYDLATSSAGAAGASSTTASGAGGQGGGGAGGAGGTGGQLDCGDFVNPAVSSVQETFDAGLGALAPHSCATFDAGSVLFPLPDPPPLDFCWVTLPGAFHLTCDSLTFRLLQATNPVLGAQTFVYLDDLTTGASANLLLEGGGFSFRRSDESAAMQIDNPLYNPSTDHYLRIRADETQLYLETSQDGASWTMRGSSELLLPIDNLSIRIGAGSYSAITASPGQARIDCINVVPCP